MGRTREAEPPEDERRPEEAEGDDAEADEEEEDDGHPRTGEGEDSEAEDGEAEEGEEGEHAFSRAYVDKLRKEAAQYRTKLKEIEDAGKSEQEKLAEERDTLRADNERLRTRVRRSNFIEKIGVSSPRLAWAALQDLTVGVEWDEDQVSNLPEIRKALKKEFPEDFGDRGVNGGDTGQAPASSDMNARIRAAAGR